MNEELIKLLHEWLDATKGGKARQRHSDLRARTQIALNMATNQPLYEVVWLGSPITPPLTYPDAVRYMAFYTAGSPYNQIRRVNG